MRHDQPLFMGQLRYIRETNWEVGYYEQACPVISWDKQGLPVVHTDQLRWVRVPEI